MRIYAVQLDPVWEDRAASVEKARGLLAAQSIESGSLIVLPEMFAAGYTMNVETADESADPIAERFLAETARQYGCCVVGGVVNRDGEGRPQNQSLIIGPDGSELGRYAKLYPTTPLGEPDHYQRGNRVVVAPFGGFRIAPAICYDVRFADVFRRSLLAGATLYAVIASFPKVRIDHWVKLLQARAIEMQAYVVGVNRTGSDPGHVYNGRSLIVDPMGEVLADAGEAETVVSAEADPAVVAEYRAKLPFIEDLKAAAWQRLCEQPAGA